MIHWIMSVWRRKISPANQVTQPGAIDGRKLRIFRWNDISMEFQINCAGRWAPATRQVIRQTRTRQIRNIASDEGEFIRFVCIVINYNKTCCDHMLAIAAGGAQHSASTPQKRHWNIIISRCVWSKLNLIHSLDSAETRRIIVRLQIGVAAAHGHQIEKLAMFCLLGEIHCGFPSGHHLYVNHNGQYSCGVCICALPDSSTVAVYQQFNTTNAICIVRKQKGSRRRTTAGAPMNGERGSRRKEKRKKFIYVTWHD